VYTNSSLASLVLVASNNDAFLFGPAIGLTNGPTSDFSSRVLLNTTAGVAYQIAVTGVGNQAGVVSLDLSRVALDDIQPVQRIVNPNDRSADFTNILPLHNSRPSLTAPLRIHLIATAGYSCLQYLQADLDFLGSLNAAEVDLGAFIVPGNLGPGSSSSVGI